MTKKPWRAGKDLSAVVENMEIGTGQRGDGRHAFVTREELVGLKLARSSCFWWWLIRPESGGRDRQ